jgi:SAM-dependent methyltransferase
MMQEHHRIEHAADHHVAFASPEAAAFVELEGDVLIGFVDDAASTLAELRGRDRRAVRRVLDLGCGPGVGTCRLAQRFASATVVAVDGSPAMLERVTTRAERLGLGERVATRLVELPAGLDELGRADVVWASMVLHHIGDETAALCKIRRLLEPGGLLALVERAGPLRVLPDDADLGRPGIWERLDVAWAAWFADMRAGLPGVTTSVEYPAMLEAAGFDVVADAVLTLDLDAPLDAAVRRFTREYLTRMQAQLARHAEPADLEALGMLVDELADDTIAGDNAMLRASRHLYVGAVMNVTQ